MKKIIAFLIILFISSTSYAGTSAYTTAQMDTAFGYVYTSTAFGRSLWSLADEAAFKALVNLEIGTDVQAYDAELAAIAGLTSAADKVPQFTASGTAQLLDIAIKSDCSGITAGFCMDSDNGYFYVWNGSSVQQIQGVVIDIVGSANINWIEPFRVPFGSGAYTSGTDSSIEFGDAGNYIWTPTDAELHLVSDGTIKLDANTVVTGNLTATNYGAATVTDAQMGYLSDTTGLIQAQINTKVTGPGSSTDNAVALWNSTTGYLAKNSTLIYAAGDLSGMDSITMNASAIPSDIFYDSDALGADKYAGRITMDMTTVTDGAEVTDINIKSQVAGADSLVAEWDGSDEAWVLGDSVSGEDLKFDFETTQDNQVEVSSNSGATEISFSALKLVTTGVIEGAINTSAKGGAYTVGTDDAHEAYGTLFISTTSAPTLTITAVAGASGCLYEGQGRTDILTIDAAASDYIVYQGVRGTIGATLASAGAAGDSICWVCYDATDIYVTSSSGTWVQP